MNDTRNMTRNDFSHYNRENQVRGAEKGNKMMGLTNQNKSTMSASCLLNKSMQKTSTNNNNNNSNQSYIHSLAQQHQNGKSAK